jgi:hypothetical protein
MSVLRYCLDRRVLAALAVAGLLIALLAPQAVGRALPLLLVAACPLSMVAMALTMNRSAAPSATPPSVESIRRELGELSTRQRRLEGELAAIDPNATG